MKTTKLKCLTVLFLLSLLSLSFSGCLSENDINTISALDGRRIADEIAKDWKEDARLIEIASFGGSNNGEFEKWRYVYFSPSDNITEDNTTKFNSIGIFVKGNEEIDKFDKNYIRYHYHESIKNWAIDSDEAVEIAKQEPLIESYLDEYSRASLGMTLMMWERLPDGRENPNRDSATWSIGWEYMGGMFEDPAHARVFINANTGDVLYVDADK